MANFVKLLPWGLLVAFSAGGVAAAVTTLNGRVVEVRMAQTAHEVLPGHPTTVARLDGVIVQLDRIEARQVAMGQDIATGDSPRDLGDSHARNVLR